MILFPEKRCETGNFDSNSILRQFKLDLMGRFTEIKSSNPKLGQDQKARLLGCSCSNLQRHRYDIYMRSPYRIPSDSHKSRQKTSSDLRRPQMALNEHNPVVDNVTEPVATVKPSKAKNNLKGSGNLEIDDERLNEFLHNFNL